jgi:hypothetical protein
MISLKKLSGSTDGPRKEGTVSAEKSGSPVELSFADHADFVRYWGHRDFSRTRAARLMTRNASVAAFKALNSSRFRSQLNNCC